MLATLRMLRPACSRWWNSTRARGCAPGWRGPAGAGGAERPRTGSGRRAGPAGPQAGLRVVVGFVHPAEGESYPVFRPET